MKDRNNFQFNRGETLTFDQWRLGDCRNYDFDRTTKISLVTTSNDQFCPTMVEVHLANYYNYQTFDEDYDNVFFARVNENGRKWFSRQTNSILGQCARSRAQYCGF